MKLIKLNKNADIASAIKAIRDLKDDEVIFELPKGSLLLQSSSNLKLLKRTAEALRKKAWVRTDDPTGQILAKKAEILEGSVEQKRPTLGTKVRRSDVKPRFSDIMLPRKINQTLASARVKFDEAPRVSPEIVPVKSGARPKRKFFSGIRHNFSKVFVITMVVLVLLVFGLAVLLPTANITIYARSEPISRDVEVTIDKTATASDSSKLLVPAVVVSREVTQTKNFPTTGTKVIGTKATGNVTIYNFTKNTLTLKAATTTLIANNKKFVFAHDVTGIRPTARIGTGTDEEIDPTSLTPPVAVVAVDVGDTSNLAAGSKFTVQNAALGNTTEVVAANDQAFTGGTSKNIQILSQADFDKAVASMTDSVALQAQTDLNSETETADTEILPAAITKEILAKTANKNVGDESTSFDMTMIAKVSGLAFHEDDIKGIILKQITSVLSDDKYLLPDAPKTLTANFKSIDLVKGTGVLSAHFETTAAYKVNEGNMSKQLAGKSATQIKEILLAHPEIDRVDVEFSPFFVNKAPKLNGKIYIHTNLSQGG